MKTKPKMTYEEHVQFARMLKDMRLMLWKVRSEGGKRTQTERAVLSMGRKLELVRHKFDSALFRNHPDKAVPTIYYGQ